MPCHTLECKQTYLFPLKPNLFTLNLSRRYIHILSDPNNIRKGEAGRREACRCLSGECRETG